MKNKKVAIIAVITLACVIMGFIDAVVKPGYMIKSISKLLVFIILPVLYSKFDKNCDITLLIKPSFKDIKISLIMGSAVYFFIVGGYFLLGNYFDFSGVVVGLDNNANVSRDNFILVCLYISFCNSLLEEFFFRGFAFIYLKNIFNLKYAYFISSFFFGAYHICMMIGWFEAPLMIAAILALIAGGAFLDYVDEKSGNIYTSWFIHMFANFAINTIGCILIGIF